MNYNDFVAERPALARYLATLAEPPPLIIDSPEAGYAYVLPLLTDDGAPLQAEHLVVAALDRKLAVIDHRVTGGGSSSGALVNVGDIYHWALSLRTRPHAILVAHNHPSGDATPSVHDHKVTDQLVKAGRLL